MTNFHNLSGVAEQRIAPSVMRSRPLRGRPTQGQLVRVGCGSNRRSEPAEGCIAATGRLRPGSLLQVHSGRLRVSSPASALC